MGLFVNCELTFIKNLNRRLASSDCLASRTKKQLNWPTNYYFRAVNDCPDCNRKCIRGTISADCTRCTCEHHVITGKVLDGNSNPINGANIYKLGYYDVLAKTTQSGQFR